MPLFNKTFFVVLLVLICCVPVTLKADILDSAVALAHSNLVLAAGGFFTLVGLLRPFKKKSRENTD
jgi:hypothetical protein